MTGANAVQYPAPYKPQDKDENAKLGRFGLEIVNPNDLSHVEGSIQELCEPQRRHILITGPSGSGKTYLSNALKSRGKNAHDADKVRGLTGWFDSAGNRVQAPPEPDEIFLNNHAFLWSRQALSNFLSVNEVVYLFGISRNALEMTESFHNVYFLKLPMAILSERLRATDRDNPMGRTAYQLEYSLKWAQINEEKAKNLGIQMIDGTLPAQEILSQIVGETKT